MKLGDRLWRTTAFALGAGLFIASAEAHIFAQPFCQQDSSYLCISWNMISCSLFFVAFTTMTIGLGWNKTQPFRLWLKDVGLPWIGLPILSFAALTVAVTIWHSYPSGSCAPDDCVMALLWFVAAVLVCAAASVAWCLWVYGTLSYIRGRDDQVC